MDNTPKSTANGAVSKSGAMADHNAAPKVPKKFTMRVVANSAKKTTVKPKPKSKGGYDSDVEPDKNGELAKRVAQRQPPPKKRVKIETKPEECSTDEESDSTTLGSSDSSDENDDTSSESTTEASSDDEETNENDTDCMSSDDDSDGSSVAADVSEDDSDEE